MSEEEEGKARALVPVDERRVTLMEGDEVLSVFGFLQVEACARVRH